MSRGRFKIRHRSNATFVLQVTSMVDMFTIILVFLLKSYSTSAVQITPHDGLKLPTSTSQTDPQEILKMVVAQDGIYVEDEKVLDMTEGQFAQNDVDANDPKFIRTLYERLDEKAKKSREIAQVNEAMKFDGKILVQADHKLSYKTLKKVMYTAMVAGYADVKMAVMAME